MDLIADLIAFVVATATAVVGPMAPPLERTVERTYQVAPGSTVAVDLSGGRVLVIPGTGRTLQIKLVQRVQATSEREFDAALESYNVAFSQEGAQVRLLARRKSGLVSPWRGPSVNMNAEISVPSDVRLDLRTSGGSIEVRGLRDAPVDARTSGGSIVVEGGGSPIAADTSGGSIRIGRAGSTLSARTSGGSIRVAEVSASASNVDVSTSGGSIRIGIDPEAKLNLEASTSGGRVSVDGLTVQTSRRTNAHLTGELNGGGGRLRASTSGGSVRIGRAGDAALME